MQHLTRPARSFVVVALAALALSAVLAGISTAQSPDGTPAHPYTDLEEGKNAARTAGKPLLVLFRTPECAFTKLFYEQTVPDTAVQEALAGLVFTSIDVEKGKGKFIGQMHEVKATPTFVLYDPDRGPLHQWKGWAPVAFIQNLSGGLRSNTPVVERLNRYETTPTAEDAALLGFFWASSGNFGGAYDAFQKAVELNSSFDFRAESFDAAASGYGTGQIPIAKLERAATDVLAQNDSDEEHVNVASILVAVTEGTPDAERAAPFLATALEKAKSSSAPNIQQAAVRLEPYRLLYLAHDPAAAVDAYQRRYPGWPNDPDALNNVAWWCRTHQIELDRAEDWARKSVDGYTEPGDRANARDTLADILLLRGKKKEAIDQLFLAFKDAPRELKYGLKLKELGAEVELPEAPSRTVNVVPSGDGTETEQESTKP
ncbi:MAG: thioredoxin family protein [Candidatus Eisenbacteria bacterium]